MATEDEKTRHAQFWNGIATVLDITGGSMFVTFADMPDQGFMNLVVKGCGIQRVGKYGEHREGEKNGIRVELIPAEDLTPLETAIREALTACGHDMNSVPTAHIQLVAARVKVDCLDPLSCWGA